MASQKTKLQEKETLVNPPEKIYSGKGHNFNEDIAADYSIPEAIIIHHFQHWCNVNARLGQNFIDGRRWTYQTIEFISAQFIYFTKKQVENILNKLTSKGVLLKRNYNKKKTDKTLWYAFKNEKMFSISPFGEMDILKRGNGYPQTGRSIPDTKTHAKTYKETNPLPPSSPKPREASASSKRASAPVGGFSKNEKKEASPGSRKRAAPNLDCPPDPEKMKAIEPLELLEAEAFIYTQRYSLENVQIGVDYTLMIIEKGTMKKSIAEVFNWAAKNPEKALQSLGKSSSSKDQEKRKKALSEFYPFNFGLKQKTYNGYMVETGSGWVSLRNSQGIKILRIEDTDFYETLKEFQNELSAKKKTS